MQTAFVARACYTGRFLSLTKFLAYECVQVLTRMKDMSSLSGHHMRLLGGSSLGRGMSGLTFDDATMMRGGIERAPMSTSNKRSVAASYAGSPDRSPRTIFEFVTEGLSTGTSISFLSVYPTKEEEYLYPVSLLSECCFNLGSPVPCPIMILIPFLTCLALPLAGACLFVLAWLNSALHARGYLATVSHQASRIRVCHRQGVS